MGTKKMKAGRVKSLAAGRPPLTHPPLSLSRKTTKRLINSHHQLEKRRRQAAVRGDEEAEATIAAEIEALGGLSRYQQASLQGQRCDRGGDSSRILMQWLGLDDKKAVRTLPDSSSRFRMLEVGALSIDNACSASGYFSMERIDLHSQHPGILQQDFLKRPRPQSDAERFDIISLSLVLNYVPQHSDRGEMLLRCLDFLYGPDNVSSDAMETGAAAPPQTASPLPRWLSGNFPSVFVVLPEPCVANSRYLTEEQLTAMMAALGFDLLKTKASQKLVYYLWKRVRPSPQTIPSFPKKEIRSGATRNNFSIVLQGTER